MTQIVAALGASLRTVARVRQQLVTEGFDVGPPSPTANPLVPTRSRSRGTSSSSWSELACSDPPEGRCHWTLQLLADELVVLGLVERDQHRDGAPGSEKNDIKPWIVETWCIPPEADAEYVWRMEDVIQTYLLPYDPKYPVVCFDEACKQLFGEVRPPRRPRPGQSGSGGLRVRAEGRLPPVADVRAVAWLAARQGDASAAPGGTTPSACGSWWTCITPRRRRSGWCRTT